MESPYRSTNLDQVHSVEVWSIVPGQHVDKFLGWECFLFAKNFLWVTVTIGILC